MRFKDITKLVIKFIGGGIINFPTRFLEYVDIIGKNNGDSPDIEPIEPTIVKTLEFDRFNQEWPNHVYTGNRDASLVPPITLYRFFVNTGNNIMSYEDNIRYFTPYTISDIKENNTFDTEVGYEEISLQRANIPLPIFGFNSTSEINDYIENLITELNLVISENDNKTYKLKNDTKLRLHINDDYIDLKYLTVNKNNGRHLTIWFKTNDNFNRQIIINSFSENVTITSLLDNRTRKELEEQL